jgi:hypothetical protein
VICLRHIHGALALGQAPVAELRAVVVIANCRGELTTSQTLPPQVPRSRRRRATSATAYWPMVDSLRASRYTVVARQVWSARGCGNTDASHNSMESFIVCLQRAVRMRSVLLTSCAVAVDGRAGRSTWIDHTEPKLVVRRVATGLWPVERLFRCHSRLFCCKGTARVLTTTLPATAPRVLAASTPTSLSGRADPDPSGSSRISTPMGCGVSSIGRRSLVAHFTSGKCLAVQVHVALTLT